jgi:hypothetical protein
MQPDNLNNRLEYKYVVPLAELDRLRRDISLYLVRDAHAAARTNGEYTVRSIYWDSPDLSCYREKLDGTFTRRKFRVRGYDRPIAESQTFFEIKLKHNDFIAKSRARVPWHDLPDVLLSPAPGELFAPDQRDAFSKYLYHWRLRHLSPAALIVYEREAFECPRGSRLRVTFDKTVRSRPVGSMTGLYDDGGLMVHDPGNFIVEVKFYQTLPRWVAQVLGDYELTRVAASKYAAAIGRSRHTLSLMAAHPPFTLHHRESTAWPVFRA